jgi:hypothetical protein
MAEAEAEKYDVVGAIMEYEQDEQSARDTLTLFSHLIKTGTINGLQGSYQRTAQQMLDGGFLTPEGDVTDFAEQMLDLFEG